MERMRYYFGVRERERSKLALSTGWSVHLPMLSTSLNNHLSLQFRSCVHSHSYQSSTSNMTRRDELKVEDTEHLKESKDATFHTAEDSFSSNDVSVSIDCQGGVEDNIEAQLPSYFDANLEDQTLDVPSPIRDQKTKTARRLAVAMSALLLVIVIVIGASVGIAMSARNDAQNQGTSLVSDNFPSGSDNFPGPDDYAGPGGNDSYGDDENVGPKKAHYNGNKNLSSTTTTIKTRPADDRLHGTYVKPNENDEIVAELPSTPPPQYVSFPPSPSCSRPPAWANDDLSWSDLSTDQRNAALYLGYTAAAWDADDDTIIEVLYANLDWYDLSSEQRLAYEYLGYNSGSYENFYNDYFFDELPGEVQDSAVALGYTQKVWDECEADVCVLGVDDMFWKGISRIDRMNLKVLGYDCWTWNNYDFSGAR